MQITDDPDHERRHGPAHSTHTALAQLRPPSKFCFWQPAAFFRESALFKIRLCQHTKFGQPNAAHRRTRPRQTPQTGSRPTDRSYAALPTQQTQLLTDSADLSEGSLPDKSTPPTHTPPHTHNSAKTKQATRSSLIRTGEPSESWQRQPHARRTD